MQQDLFAHMFKSLVAQIGGVDGAAAAISAAVGRQVSIGTISKITNGNADVPMLWAYALEDATGNRCFTNLRDRAVSSQEAASAVVGHLDLLRESTEAVEAMAHAEASPDRDKIVRARKETADLHEQSGRALEAYDAMLSKLKVVAS